MAHVRNKVKKMERIQIDKMQSMSGYKLSHIVSSLVFVKPNARGQIRPDKAKKAVLRVLCDHYPNVWPSLKAIADKTSYSLSQTRRVLRELESKDRLLVDISTNSKHRFLEMPDKTGGYGKDSAPQYFILDRKIFDIYQQQKMWKAWDEAHSSEAERAVMREPKAGHMRIEGHSYENRRPVISASNDAERAVTMTAKPTILENLEELTEHMQPTSQPERASRWLERRVTSILSKKTGSPRTATAKERIGLNKLATKHWEVLPALAFYHFVEREPFGIDGLNWPITVFLNEADTWIKHAVQEMEGKGNRDQDHGGYSLELKQVISDLVEERGIEPTEDLVSMLCELAERHSELSDGDWYDFAAVQDYLQTCHAEPMAAVA